MPVCGSGATASADGACATVVACGPAVAVVSKARPNLGCATMPLPQATEVGEAGGFAAGFPDLQPPGSTSALLVNGGAEFRSSPCSLLPRRHAGDPVATFVAKGFPA